MQNRTTIGVTADPERNGVVFVRVRQSFPDVHAIVSTSYAVLGSGDVLVESHYMGPDSVLPEMPRFGMRLRLPEEYSRLEWFGRGPHENYVDRKTSAFVGRYRSTVDDQFFPYVSPQESGYKTDVRWVALTAPDGHGIAAIGSPHLSFSALPYTTEDLSQERRGSMHPTDLKKSPFVEWCVDYAQMGVGGDDSWGALPHEQCLLKEKEYRYRYRLRPFSPGESPAALALQAFDVDRWGAETPTSPQDK